MLRRDAIRQLSMLFGGTLSAPVLSGILAGCSAPSGTGPYTPRSLSIEQHNLIGLIAETIIPRTDSPGALDAGVHRFIDTLLTDYYSEENRRIFLQDLSGLIRRANEAFSGPFESLSSSQQTEFVAALDAETFPPPDEIVPVEYSDVDEPVAPNVKPFFWQLKELVLAGYYTSEIGSTLELHIAPYSEYKGDISLESVGNTWA